MFVDIFNNKNNGDLDVDYVYRSENVLIRYNSMCKMCMPRTIGIHAIFYTTLQKMSRAINV